MDVRKKQYLDTVKNQVSAAMKQHRVLITYAKDAIGQKVGVVVAYCLDDVIYMGWSLCNTKGNGIQKGDNFDRILGLHKALFRAKPLGGGPFSIPWSIEPEWCQIHGRALRYFKQAAINSDKAVVSF